MTTAVLEQTDLGAATARVDRGSAFTFSPLLAALPGASPVSSEAVRTLRSSFMVRHVQAGRRAAAVCGATAGVSCTLTAVNLAVSLAQIGIKTLLVDADMRNPGVDQLIRPSAPVKGLAHCLASDDLALHDVIEPDVLPNLSVLFAGTAANPQELLAGSRFEDLMALCLREYEATIVDTPPASLSADARQVSRVVGYSLIVARTNASYVHDLKVLLEQLREDHVRIIGTVLNEG
jgi:capsular exopolysaccharide synthesis family protein